MNYTVKNAGSSDTPASQSEWTDLIYLSRDTFLDLSVDRYLGSVDHTGGLASGASYQASQSVRTPSDLIGAYYVFVVTDAPIRSPRGVVFEGNNEGNNATPSVQPILIDVPPPSDLQVDAIQNPLSAQTGDPIHLEWTVSDHSTVPANGAWTDAIYVSTDAIWDIHDTLVGRVTHNGPLGPGASYTATLDSVLPVLKPGTYHFIVRTDLYNEVYEGTDEGNNKTASPGVFTVTVPEIHLSVPFNTTLSTGEDRLFQLTVAQGQTLSVDLTTSASNAANEIFLRYGDVPTSFLFDASYQSPLQPDQTATIPRTQAGTYYILVRGQSEPGNDTPITLLAHLIPFQITNVIPDTGGDSRYVSTTILGADFDPAGDRQARPAGIRRV